MKRVYFIKPIGMDGPVKIGCSCSPDGRRSTLQTWCPFPLEVVAEIDGDFDLEKRFHTLFGDSHKGREWFNVTPSMKACIAAIKAGTFDINILPDASPINRFRKPKDKSYMTPEWCYKRSFHARLQHVRGRDWQLCLAGLTRILGDNRYGKTTDYLGHKEELEELLVEVRDRASARKAAA